MYSKKNIRKKLQKSEDIRFLHKLEFLKPGLYYAYRSEKVPEADKQTEKGEKRYSRKLVPVVKQLFKQDYMATCTKAFFNIKAIEKVKARLTTLAGTKINQQKRKEQA